MAFDINTGIDEGGGDFQPIPPGKYVMKIVKAETGIAKSGKAKVDINLSVEGDFDDEYIGRMVFIKPTLVGKSTKFGGRVGQLIKAVHAIGEPEYQANLEALLDKIEEDDKGFPIHTDDFTVWDEIFNLIVDCNVLATVNIEEDEDGEYPDKNDTKRFEPATEA